MSTQIKIILDILPKLLYDTSDMENLNILRVIHEIYLTTCETGNGHTDSRVKCRLAVRTALLIELKAQFYKLVTLQPVLMHINL